LRSTTRSENFQWWKLFPCYSLLWVPDIQPKCFNLHNTHQKSNCQTLFLHSEKKNNWKTRSGQKFRRGQKFRLTPVANDPSKFSTHPKTLEGLALSYIKLRTDFTSESFTLHVADSC